MRKLKSLLASSKLMLAATLLLSVSYAGAVVNSTQSRLVFNEKSMAESLVLVNSERAPALVQVWSDDNDPLAPPDRISTPLIVVPPVFKLEPGESRNLRVMLSSRQGMPSDRERVYWLNIYQFPPTSQVEKAADKKVILPLRIRLKVFIRPDGLKAPEENIGEALEFTLKKGSNQSQSLKITNPTPYYISLGEINLEDEALTPKMLEPKSSLTLPVLQVGNNRKLNWSVIDDYGKQTMYQRAL